MDDLNQAVLIKSIIGTWGPDSANLDCPICKSNAVIMHGVTQNKSTDCIVIAINFTCAEDHPWSLVLKQYDDDAVEIWIEMPIIDYQAFIASNEWKEKAYAAKKRAGWRCQLCNRCGYKGKGLHAHHRTYERLTNEEPGDITVLCASCHAKFHGK